MIDSLLQIKNNLKETSINNFYIFIDKNTKFIFNNSSLDKIIGMNNLLENKIVKISNETVKNDKKIAQLKVDNENIGWTEISNTTLIRLYRIPKVKGKLKESINKNYSFNDRDYSNDILQLSDKLVKIHYLFYYNDKKHLFISRIDGKNLIPVRDDMINKLIEKDEESEIHLHKGTPLFATSTFNTKVSEIKKSREYKINSYINATNIIRIEIDEKKYWVKTKDLIYDPQSDNYDIKTLEIVDFITQLFESNKSNENRIKILENKMRKISESITYENENEKLYIKKYLGDSYDD
ncbi:hypothetical protein [Jeotgalicoccus psychrophilus]|uniref:hypothetical protein n=1 Tax=Jeotgalicoccus psychrophilus TaxID=157228 RepID=UPI0004244D22|nr:hypothetical protein [Jeotgalicoccus psychrophilus]